MSFLIFLNSNYILFTELSYLSPSYMTFILNFGLLGVCAVIFDLLNFSEMSFLIFSTSNYSLFTEPFLFEASLYDFFKKMNFGVEFSWDHF